MQVFYLLVDENLLFSKLFSGPQDCTAKLDGFEPVTEPVRNFMSRPDRQKIKLLAG